jgi:hypothetical protein|tara:strand:- start:2030 stop:2341 length:312 start_codon:yes stop_codon:yes gene_type:complete
MRTNSIDATAFRCLAEYHTLVEIYSSLYDKDYSHHINDYLEELIKYDTPKEMRKRHTERIDYIKKRINKRIEKDDVKENIIIDEAPKRENIKLKIAKPRNINE